MTQRYLCILYYNPIDSSQLFELVIVQTSRKALIALIKFVIIGIVSYLFMSINELVIMLSLYHVLICISIKQGHNI